MNRISNLVPYFILVVVITSFFVWRKIESTADMNRIISEMNQKIHQWVGEDGASLSLSPIIIDVRSDSEFQVSHCRRAINIPYERMKEEMFLLLLSRNAPVLVYSRSGRLSAKAADCLRAMEFKHVYNLNEMNLHESPGRKEEG